MAANRYGIDVAELYNTKENIEGKRTRNAMAALQLGEAQRVVKERPAREAAALREKNMLTGLRRDAAGGVEGAAETLISLDPTNGPAFIDALAKMDDREKEETKARVEEMGQLSAYVLNGKDAAEQQRRYQLMYKGASEDVRAKLPETYDPEFMELSMSKAVTMDQLLEAPTTVGLGNEDVMFNNFGKEIERAEKPIKDGKGSGGGAAGGTKAADENLIYKQSVELLGGVFDQAGNIINLDPEVRNKVQSIATEATRIWANDGSLTRSQAVAEAAKKYGLNIKDVPAADPADPANIRNFITK